MPIKTAREHHTAPPGKKDIALREKWNADKLRDQKETEDKLIAQLGRKLVDHYLFFQRLLKDDGVDLDTVSRFTDEARERIEGSLPLFMVFQPRATISTL